MVTQFYTRHFTCTRGWIGALLYVCIFLFPGHPVTHTLGRSRPVRPSSIRGLFWTSFPWASVLQKHLVYRFPPFLLYPSFFSPSLLRTHTNTHAHARCKGRLLFRWWHACVFYIPSIHAHSLANMSTKTADSGNQEAIQNEQTEKLNTCVKRKLT